MLIRMEDVEDEVHDAEDNAGDFSDAEDVGCW
jgi:hypothetical protein